MSDFIPGNLYRLTNQRATEDATLTNMILLCTVQMYASYNNRIEDNAKDYCMIDIRTGQLWSNKVNEFPKNYVDVTQELLDKCGGM